MSAKEWLHDKDQSQNTREQLQKNVRMEGGECTTCLSMTVRRSSRPRLFAPTTSPAPLHHQDSHRNFPRSTNARLSGRVRRSISNNGQEIFQLINCLDVTLLVHLFACGPRLRRGLCSLVYFLRLGSRSWHPAPPFTVHDAPECSSHSYRHASLL